jgi:hypothetical protein
MNQDWHNFKDKKPSFVTIEEEIKFSNQLFFFIDGKLYMGYYTSSLYHDADEDKDEWDESIDLAKYSLTRLSDQYIEQETIYSNDFENHEIYWHSIDLLGIICSVDLQKMQREDDENGSVKTGKRIDG